MSSATVEGAASPGPASNQRSAASNRDPADENAPPITEFARGPAHQSCRRASLPVLTVGLPRVEPRAAGFTDPEDAQSPVAVRRHDGADAALPALMTAARQRDRRQQRGGRDTDDAPHRLTLSIAPTKIKLVRGDRARLTASFGPSGRSRDAGTPTEPSRWSCTRLKPIPEAVEAHVESAVGAYVDRDDRRRGR